MNNIKSWTNIAVHWIDILGAVKLRHGLMILLKGMKWALSIHADVSWNPSFPSCLKTDVLKRDCPANVGFLSTEDVCSRKVLLTHLFIYSGTVWARKKNDSLCQKNKTKQSRLSSRTHIVLTLTSTRHPPAGRRPERSRTPRPLPFPVTRALLQRLEQCHNTSQSEVSSLVGFYRMSWCKTVAAYEWPAWLELRVPESKRDGEGSDDWLACLWCSAGSVLGKEQSWRRLEDDHTSVDCTVIVSCTWIPLPSLRSCSPRRHQRKRQATANCSVSFQLWFIFSWSDRIQSIEVHLSVSPLVRSQCFCTKHRLSNIIVPLFAPPELLFPSQVPFYFSSWAIEVIFHIDSHVQFSSVVGSWNSWLLISASSWYKEHKMFSIRHFVFVSVHTYLYNFLCIYCTH